MRVNARRRLGTVERRTISGHGCETYLASNVASQGVDVVYPQPNTLTVSGPGKPGYDSVCDCYQLGYRPPLTGVEFTYWRVCCPTCAPCPAPMVVYEQKPPCPECPACPPPVPPGKKPSYGWMWGLGAAAAIGGVGYGAYLYAAKKR